MIRQGTPRFVARGEAFADDSLLPPLALSGERQVQSLRTQRALEARRSVMPHEAFAGQENQTDYVPAIDLDLGDRADRREQIGRFAARAATVAAAALVVRRVLGK